MLILSQSFEFTRLCFLYIPQKIEESCLFLGGRRKIADYFLNQNHQTGSKAVLKVEEDQKEMNKKDKTN